MTSFSYGIFQISYTIIIHIVFLRIVIFYESTYLNHLHLLVSIPFPYKNNNNMLELFVNYSEINQFFFDGLRTRHIFGLGED